MTEISREKAQELVLAYVAALDPQKDLNGYRYQFAGMSTNKLRPHEWAAVFDVYSPTGSLMDGPVVLVVDKATGQIRDLSEVGRSP